jgi:formylmethanofuran dehydrogenase subunit E
MSYPPFYERVEKIKLYDPLAEFLGSFDDGLVKFKYTNIVQIAGHSCPTVAGAYLMTLVAVKELYGDELPVRGNIKVEFKENMDEGVVGVIATVISAITGATKSHGFKGISGKFSRVSLMDFEKSIDSSARFTRTDTGQSVDVYYDPSVVPVEQRQQILFQKLNQNIATQEEHDEFKQLWQKRVENILCNYNDYDGLLKVKQV